MMRLMIVQTLLALQASAFIGTSRGITIRGRWSLPVPVLISIPGDASSDRDATHPTTLFVSVDTSSNSRTDVAPPQPDAGFIAVELRGAAMKLHTTRQAPKEGGVLEKEQKEQYIPTRKDYLAFLVDSQHVYQALEDIVNGSDKLEQFRNTGLERTAALENDVEFMVAEYGLKRPEVGVFGKIYAEHLRAINSIPEFMCHYYNFYFAHTAGGRMIGKQMSALLLDRKTLEFYKVCNFGECSNWGVIFFLVISQLLMW